MKHKFGISSDDELKAQIDDKIPQAKKMSATQAFNTAYANQVANGSTQIYKVSGKLAEDIDKFYNNLGLDYRTNIPYHTLVIANGACYFVSNNNKQNDFKLRFSLNALGGKSDRIYDHFIDFIAPNHNSSAKPSGQTLGNVNLSVSEDPKLVKLINSRTLSDKDKHKKLDPIALKELPIARDIVTNYSYLDQLVTSNTPTVAIWFNDHPILVWYLGFLSTRNYIRIAKSHLEKAYKSNDLNGISTNSQTLRLIQRDNEGSSHNSLIPRRIYAFKPDTITADNSTTHNAIDFATLKKAVMSKSRNKKL